MTFGGQTWGWTPPLRHGMALPQRGLRGVAAGSAAPGLPAILIYGRNKTYEK